MLDNAWTYNKKTSRVYKYCSKLAEVFEQCINGAMIKLGYCCGMRVSVCIVWLRIPVYSCVVVVHGTCWNVLVL